MMGEGTVLSDLCKICSSKPPKYCCPRCHCLTCSLPCYKRHKTWSQCSGKRDPAAYLARSQLATPAGIDHDYNFLTGIERSFDRADRTFAESGISLDDFVAKPKTNSLRLARCLEATGVIIHRAPRGMSRQKQNSTHVSRFQGQDCVSWTIEWFLPDASKHSKNAEDHISVRNAYVSLLGKKEKSPTKKRKLSKASEGGAHFLDSPEIRPSPRSSDGKTHTQEEEYAAEKDNVAESSAEATELTATANTSNSQESSSVVLSDSKVEQSDPYFYLLKPRTIGTTRVLIPLSSSETIRSILRNREVLEFPTLYALEESPGELPEGFQLEHDYIIKERKWIKEIDEELKPFLEQALSSSNPEAAPVESSTDSVFNESRVLESLQRDLASATDTNES